LGFKTIKPDLANHADRSAARQGISAIRGIRDWGCWGSKPLNADLANHADRSAARQGISAIRGIRDWAVVVQNH
jgi:hypothetical protein